MTTNPTNDTTPNALPFEVYNRHHRFVDELRLTPDAYHTLAALGMRMSPVLDTDEEIAWWLNAPVASAVDVDTLPAAEDERLAVYEREREELAAAIIKAVNGQYIGKPPPLLTGWQERAVSAVLAAGWLPPAAVQERVDAEVAQLRVEVADHTRAAEIDEDTKSELAAENIELRAEVVRLRDVAADALANQTALKGMTVDEGALVLELGPPRELVIAWVDAARKMLGDAENYSETRVDFPRESFSMEVKAVGEFERYVFTVQRAGKITPHEARRAAEAEVEQLRARLAELEASNA